MEGDIWYPDKCTECSCNNRIVNCQRIECTALDTICEENMIPILVNETEERCCAKYLCGESLHYISRKKKTIPNIKVTEFLLTIVTQFQSR